MRDSATSHQIRCLHLDPDRPSDVDGEFHWRCTARFTYDGDLPSWQRDFCPYHRLPYRPTDQIATKAEVEEVNRTLGRLHRTMTMPEARLDGDGLSEEERAWAAARKRELVTQAIEAGVLTREPGAEG